MDVDSLFGDPRKDVEGDSQKIHNKMVLDINKQIEHSKKVMVSSGKDNNDYISDMERKISDIGEMRLYFINSLEKIYHQILHS